MKLGLSTYSLDGEISSGRMTLGDVLDWIAANGGECAELVPFAYQFEKDGVIDHESIRQTVRRAKDAGIELVNYSVLADLCKTGEDLEKEVRRICLIYRVSPFHTSMFITNNASIGLMRVYHHIYNFGDTSMFISMGTPQRGYSVDAGGNVVRKCTLPIGVTVDERVCGGAVYAKLFAVMKNCLRHPEQLETPPEKVFYNKGCEFHVPKPENVFHPAGAAEGSVTA